MTTLTSLSEPRAASARPAHDTLLLQRLRREWAPTLEEIRAGTRQRDLDHELPVRAVQLLKQARFGAVRVPGQHGGCGATITELTQLWIELAAVDANLPQVFRGHFALLEDRLWQHARGHDQTVWFERFVAGQMVGNAWAEVGGTAVDSQRTTLRELPGGDFRLDGTKYYTTGTIFSEWVDVHASVRRQCADGPSPGGSGDDFAIALVDTSHPGVTVTDDWDGVGQRGTGSGTTTFTGVEVPASHVLPFGQRFPYQTGLYQLNLLATLAGIARAALEDVVEQVRSRTRNYSHANAARVRDDAQVLARVGEIAAAVYAAEAATVRVGASLQAVAELATAGPDDIAAAVESSEVESSTAQVVVTDLVLRATSDLFDVLGASALTRTAGLDRHWRNARTVASHNPRILKARVVGDYAVNGTPPPYAWTVGTTKAKAER